MKNKIEQPQLASATSPVVSSDILAREPITNAAEVKHILIGWKGTDDSDARATARTKHDAEAQVKTVMDQVNAGTDFDSLMKQFSEDPGSAGNGRAYKVAPDAQLVIEFKQLGLRLKVGEVGVVQSDFGFHIMKRVE
jgi:peptidyl-prolyl cis-trans isomerase D